MNEGIGSFTKNALNQISSFFAGLQMTLANKYKFNEAQLINILNNSMKEILPHCDGSMAESITKAIPLIEKDIKSKKIKTAKELVQRIQDETELKDLMKYFW